MALPKLLQKLFDNLGLGPKLRKDIIPTDITVDKATNADSATKASQDANGNVIDQTYLTRTDASNMYLEKTGKASSATSADSATKATSADKLTTARTISLAGQVTGSGSFDGSGNLSIAATLANSGVSAGTSGPSANVTTTGGDYGHSTSFVVPYFTVDAKGRVTARGTRTITFKAGSCSHCSHCGDAMP